MTRTILTLALAAALAAPAGAADFTRPVLNEDGKPFTRCLKFDDQVATRCLQEVDYTLGRMLYDSLNVPEQNMTPEQVVQRGVLATKILQAKDLELDDRQRDLAKSALFAAVGKLGFRPVAVVEALRVIDPAAVKEK